MNLTLRNAVSSLRFGAPIAVALLLVGASSARAAVFNVASPGTPGAGDVACAPCATIQGGVDKAAVAAGPDEVAVAAGVFGENVTIAPGNDVTVTGAGAGVTTLDGGGAVALTMDHPATVRRVRIIGTGARIVDLNGGSLAEAIVERDAATPGTTAVNIGTGTGSAILRDSTVRMPLSAVANYGVYIDTTVGEPQILRSVVEAGYAVNVTSPRPVKVAHSTLRANIYALIARDAVTTSVAVSNCLILPVTAAGVDGTGVFKQGLSNATVSVTGSTIVGTGRTIAVSAIANAAVAGSVDVVDSILAGHRLDVDLLSVGGNPTIRLTRTLYDPSKVGVMGPGVVDSSGGGNLPGVVPDFVSPLTSDFRLRATSPAVDAGTPGPLTPADPTTDILGEPRLADGNGDGVLRRDLGAFERPTPPPLPGAAPPPPSAPAPTAPVTPVLTIAKPRGTVRGRILRLRITASAAGRLVLVARNAAGRVVGRRVVGRLSAGGSTVLFKLSPAARSGVVVVSATLSVPGARPAKEVQFARLLVPAKKKP